MGSIPIGTSILNRMDRRNLRIKETRISKKRSTKGGGLIEGPPLGAVAQWQSERLQFFLEFFCNPLKPSVDECAHRAREQHRRAGENEAAADYEVTSVHRMQGQSRRVARGARTRAHHAQGK